MQPNQTGDRRLWHVTVQINASTIVGGPGGKVWSLIGFYHLNTYIYIYTRNAWVLPRRCSVEVSHSQTNVDATSQNSYGKNNKGSREY